MHLKISSAKWRLVYLCFNMLNHTNEACWRTYHSVYSDSTRLIYAYVSGSSPARVTNAKIGLFSPGYGLNLNMGYCVSKTLLPSLYFRMEKHLTNLPYCEQKIVDSVPYMSYFPAHISHGHKSYTLTPQMFKYFSLIYCYLPKFLVYLHQFFISHKSIVMLLNNWSHDVAIVVALIRSDCLDMIQYNCTFQ